MHITSTDHMPGHHRTLTTLASAMLGVIVTTGALVAAVELRPDGSDAPAARAPAAASTAAASSDEMPSLLEGDPRAFDDAVAGAAAAMHLVPELTSGVPTAFDGAHGAFEAAVAEQLVLLGVDR